MSSHLSSHISMAQNYYNDIQTQYQAIQAHNGANATPINTVAGAVEYHRQNQNLETDAKNRTYFSGTSEDAGTFANAITLGDSFTQEMWIRPIETSAHMAYKDILGSITSQHHLGAPCVWLHQNGLHYGFGDGKTWQAPYTDNGHIKLGVWNHVAVTFHEGTYKSFVNGKEIHSDAIKCQGKKPLNVPITFKVGVFGCERWLQPFKGEIDDIRIWDVARTVDQIRESMCLPILKVEDNLKSIYGSKKIAELTDYDLQTSSPSALQTKATAIHNLVMRMNDVSAVVDQRNNIEQLKSYVSQLSRIHRTFVHAKEKLQLSFELQQKQAELVVKNNQLQEKEQLISTLTTNVQSKDSEIHGLQSNVQSQEVTIASLEAQKNSLIAKKQELKLKKREKQEKIDQQVQELAQKEMQRLQLSIDHQILEEKYSKLLSDYGKLENQHIPMQQIDNNANQASSQVLQLCEKMLTSKDAENTRLLQLIDKQNQMLTLLAAPKGEMETVTSFVGMQNPFPALQGSKK